MSEICYKERNKKIKLTSRLSQMDLADNKIKQILFKQKQIDIINNRSNKIQLISIMNYSLDMSYLKTPHNSKSYYYNHKLEKESFIVDNRKRDKNKSYVYNHDNQGRTQTQYSEYENKNKINPTHIIDPVLSSLKRDQLLLMSKHNNKSSLISIMHNNYSHPHYQHNPRITQKNQSNKSHLSTQLSQSLLIYPYTYSEYSLMKEKMQQKRRVQDQWLENELKRIRMESEEMLHYQEKKRRSTTMYNQAVNIQQNRKVKQSLLKELKQSKFQHPLLSKTETHNENRSYHYKYGKYVSSKQQQTMKKQLYGSCKQMQHTYDIKNEQQSARNTFLYDDLKQQNSDYEESQQQIADEQNQKQHCQRSKRSKNRNNAYSKLIVFNSKRQQHMKQSKDNSSYKSQTILNDNNNQHSYRHRLQYYQQQINTEEKQEMNLYNNKSGQPHYPIFSPLKVYKHLPHDENQHVLYNYDSKKQSKHSRALEEKKQNEYGANTNYHRQNVMEELQKKKMLTKSYDHQTFVQRKAFYQHKKNQENVMMIMEGDQLRKNTEVHPNHNLRMIFNHQHHHHQHQSQQSTQAIANGLKVQLEILKQQLDDKNKKVVDLEIELLELKCSIFEKTHQKKLRQVSEMNQEQTQTQLPENSMESQKNQTQAKGTGSLVIESHDVATQTTPLHKRTLHLTKVTVSHHLQTVQPHKPTPSLQHQLQKQRVLRKRLQQKLDIQQQAMNNFLEDIQIYQNKNKQLQNQVKSLEKEKSVSPSSSSMKQ